MFQPGDPYRRFDCTRIALQILPRAATDCTRVQRIQRQRAPQAAFDIEAHAHAIVNGQRLAGMILKQAIVWIGEAAVRLEPARLTLRKYRRQPRVLRDDEAPAESLLHQTYRRQRPDRKSVV